MNLRQLLKKAGVRNDIIKEVERKAQRTTSEDELKHQEQAMAMTKMMINEALRTRMAVKEEPPFPKKTIITGDD